MELPSFDFVRSASFALLLLSALCAGPALAQAPAEATLRFHLAQEARRQGDTARAAEWLESAVGLDPAAAAPRIEWAALLLEAGDAAGAERALAPLDGWWAARRVGVADGLAVRYARLRGATAVRRGDGDGAIAWYESAAERAPGDLGLRAQLIGQYRARQDEGRALVHLAVVVQLMPANAEVRLEMGRSLLALARWSEAETVFADATVLDPRLERAWDGLGVARAKRNDLTGAEEAFRQGLAVAPASAAIYEHLGDALLAGGRIEDALQAYRRAATLAPNESRLAQKVGSAATAMPSGDVPTVAPATPQ